MKVTLLGSGDAIGIPAPMCDCKYCQESKKRRRSGLLIEGEKTTVVVDISPDIKEQLHHEDVYDVDGFLVTHFHYDHFHGIQELNHVALKDEQHVSNPEKFDYQNHHSKELEIYGNKKTREHLTDNHQNVITSENTHYHLHGKNNVFEIGEFTITTFGIDHGNEDTTQGYVIEENGKKIVYAPDSKKLEKSEAYQNADLFFAEGQLFRAKGHADQDKLEKQLEEANPDRIILLSITEHLNQMHTEEIEKEAEKKGYEIWKDYQSVIL